MYQTFQCFSLEQDEINSDLRVHVIMLHTISEMTSKAFSYWCRSCISTTKSSGLALYSDQDVFLGCQRSCSWGGGRLTTVYDSHLVKKGCGSLPVSERLRLREPPHPAQSENLDHVVRVQSSLHGTRHSLACRGKGPAHRRHSVMLADSPLSATQLIPAETQRNRTSPHSHLAFGSTSTSSRRRDFQLQRYI